MHPQRQERSSITHAKENAARAAEIGEPCCGRGSNGPLFRIYRGSVSSSPCLTSSGRYSSLTLILQHDLPALGAAVIHQWAWNRYPTASPEDRRDRAAWIDIIRFAHSAHPPRMAGFALSP